MSKVRRSRERSPEVPEVAWKIMHDEEVLHNTWDWLIFAHYQKGDVTLNEPSLQDYWEQYGDEIVAQWIIDKPGTRPKCWYRWSCPPLQPWPRIMGLPDPRPKDETETEFLRRHGFLTPEEQNVLRNTGDIA